MRPFRLLYLLACVAVCASSSPTPSTSRTFSDDDRAWADRIMRECTKEIAEKGISSADLARYARPLSECLQRRSEGIDISAIIMSDTPTSSR